MRPNRPHDPHRPAAHARFRRDDGFEGAEKALLISFGLAIIILIAVLLRGGSESAAKDAERVLKTAQGGTSALGQVAQSMHAGDVKQPAAPAPAPAAAPAPKKDSSEGGVLGHVGGFFSGLYDGAKDTVVGLGGMAVGTWNLTGGWVTDPSAAHGTWDHLTGTVSTVVQHPGQLWDAIKQPYVTAWSEGRPGEAIGRGTFEAVTIILGTKGLDKLGKAGKIAEATGDLGKVSELEKAAEIERLAELARAADLQKAADAEKAAKEAADARRDRRRGQAAEGADRRGAGAGSGGGGLAGAAGGEEGRGRGLLREPGRLGAGPGGEPRQRHRPDQAGADREAACREAGSVGGCQRGRGQLLRAAGHRGGRAGDQPGGPHAADLRHAARRGAAEHRGADRGHLERPAEPVPRQRRRHADLRQRCAKGRHQGL